MDDFTNNFSYEEIEDQYHGSDEWYEISISENEQQIFDIK